MGELIDMLNNNVKVYLRLYVVSLYNICWEFCEEEYYNECIGIEKYMVNYRGLRNFM